MLFEQDCGEGFLPKCSKMSHTYFSTQIESLEDAHPNSDDTILNVLSKIAAPLFPKVNPPCVTPVRLPDGPAEIGTFFRFDNQVDVVGHQAVRPDLYRLP